MVCAYAVLVIFGISSELQIGLYGEPYGVNDAPSTPLPEGVRSYFANDPVRTVDIGVDRASIRRAVESPLDPLAPVTARVSPAV